ncbi:PrpF domain-containing protein [Amycolatopsis sp. NPDC059027]|uniref:PrpF domain-containing protein n=1 Tax=Amycolatopsis sp. NPDC059027 TaxID=3346709 RepID=UPI003672647A
MLLGRWYLTPGGASRRPPGRAVDMLESREKTAKATLVDAGAPAALVDAPSLGLTGSESVAEFGERLPSLLGLRRAAAIRMGLSTPDSPISHAVPKLGIVGPAADYTTTGGTHVTAGEFDVAVRMASMHAPHPVIGLTSMVAVAAAATVPGSTVRAHTATENGEIRIGTAAGVVSASLRTSGDGALTGVTLNRSARVIARADIFVPAAAREAREPAVAR